MGMQAAVFPHGDAVSDIAAVANVRPVSDYAVGPDAGIGSYMDFVRVEAGRGVDDGCGMNAGGEPVGIVELGDDVDVGANTTIDRARFGRTIVGEGTKIDNLIQLGHNVVVGRHCIIVAQSGIAGSTKVGDYATIAAQVGISGHLNIGSKSTLGAKTGVLSDIPENSTYWGMPAFPYKDATRQYAALKKLPALIKEVRALKKELDSSGK